MSWILRFAIRILQKALSKDPSYYISWQSGIAMPFYDKYLEKRKSKRYLNNKDIHTVANEAAKNFLNLLIKK